VAPTGLEVAMLAEFCPRIHTRYTSLHLLGPYVEGFFAWLQAEGYPPLPIRLRLHVLPRLEAGLWRRGVRRLEDLRGSELLRLRPRDSQDDIYLSAVVRSLTRYLKARGVLGEEVLTPGEEVITAYRTYLERARGLAGSTVTQHCATAGDLLSFIGFDSAPTGLRALGPPQLERFLRSARTRLCRASLQHTAAHLRSLIRFLADRGEVDLGLDRWIDTPRLYRGEQLPRALPWETVQAFLTAIDRSTAMGRRDYAMFLLIVTYGLRTSEVTALRLDDVEWRARRIRVGRPKTKTPLILPLTDEVGAAVVAYLRHARPDLPYRAVFLRVRAPAGRLKPTAVTEAFQAWTRRGGLPIPYQGPHCLRHSLAVHLLRQGAPLKAIGDLLGHRSLESTCVYLRLHVEDLRDAALELPQEARP
jgi:integrase/recombinase XerD